MERQLGKIVHTQRNLFGPVDHEQLHWDFQHMLRSNIEVAQQKWNFDFLQDVPMEGFLQWEELGGHEVPAFYHSCVVRESRRPLWHLHQPLCREEKAHQLTLAALVEKPKASKQTGAGKVPEGNNRYEMPWYCSDDQTCFQTRNSTAGTCTGFALKKCSPLKEDLKENKE